MFTWKIIPLALVATILNFVIAAISYASTITVTSYKDDPVPELLTLREAIAKAQENDTIDFAPSLDGQRITISTARGTLNVNKNLTITAATLKNGVIVDGNGGKFSVFTIRTNKANLVRLTIEHGNAEYGGGIYAEGQQLDLQECTFASNAASASGGGLDSRSIHTNIERCAFHDNTAQLYGGGAVISPSGEASSLNVLGSTFTENTSNNLDSAVSAGVTTVSFSECQFNQNASQYGGVVAITFDRSFQCDNCQFADNSIIRGPGAALRCLPYGPSGDGIATISDCVINHTNGTGLRCGDYAHTVITNCRITNNALGVDNVNFVGPNSMTEINHCVISDNHAINPISPGGIRNIGYLTISDTTIANNSARQGGGIRVGSIRGDYQGQGENRLMLNRCTISGNTATSGNGGGIQVVNESIYGVSVSAFLNTCTVSGNTATDARGGGIHLGDNCSLVLDSVTIAANLATGDRPLGIGGGVYVQPSGRCNVHNALIGNNIDEGEFAPDINGGITSGGYNLVSRLDGSDGWIGTDHTGTISDPLDPILADLGDYGGTTETHALLVGSPAIDSGDPALVGTEDQRRVRRDTFPDIGSFEFTGKSSFPLRGLVKKSVHKSK